MATNSDYRVLILTSDPATIEEVTVIGRANFEHSTCLFWEMGNRETRPGIVRELEATDYNLIVSYINGIILKPQHLERATFGAINVHPAPPEHGGAFGLMCQPVIRRDIRTHHGVTLHEMDAAIDHGTIYRVKRWDVAPDATIQSVYDRSFSECLTMYAEAAEELGRSAVGTACFTPSGDEWDSVNRYHTADDVRAWFAMLDSAHPAHAERVPFNHPRAIAAPPYFDDL